MRCSLCQKKFTLNIAYQTHKAVCKEANSKCCHYCGKEFTSHEHRLRHERNSHDKNRKFSCPHCPCRSPNQMALKGHVTREHKKSLNTEDNSSEPLSKKNRSLPQVEQRAPSFKTEKQKKKKNEQQGASSETDKKKNDGKRNDETCDIYWLSSDEEETVEKHNVDLSAGLSANCCSLCKKPHSTARALALHILNKH